MPSSRSFRPPARAASKPRYGAKERFRSRCSSPSERTFIQDMFQRWQGMSSSPRTSWHGLASLRWFEACVALDRFPRNEARGGLEERIFQETWPARHFGSRPAGCPGDLVWRRAMAFLSMTRPAAAGVNGCLPSQVCRHDPRLVRRVPRCRRDELSHMRRASVWGQPGDGARSSSNAGRQARIIASGEAPRKASLCRAFHCTPRSPRTQLLACVDKDRGSALKIRPRARQGRSDH